jgi:hypothetical protein
MESSFSLPEFKAFPHSWLSLKDPELVVTSICGFVLMVDFYVEVTGPKRDLEYKFH